MKVLVRGLEGFQIIELIKGENSMCKVKINYRSTIPEKKKMNFECLSVGEWFTFKNSKQPRIKVNLNNWFNLSENTLHTPNNSVEEVFLLRGEINLQDDE